MSVASFGVVVLTHGEGDEHLDLIRGLLEEGIEPDSIVVVHNPTGPHQEVAIPDLKIQVIRLGRNLGYAAGMNAGIRHHLRRGVARVLILTREVRLRPRAVDLLVEAARRDPRFGVLGPALWWRGEDRPFSYGGRRWPAGEVGHFRERRPTANVNGIAECDWIDGAAMLVDAEVFRQVGLLDERFFLYFEETEFCLRAVRMGWRVGVVLGAVAEQAPGASRWPGAYAYLISRNGLEYARRAGGTRGTAVALLRRLEESLSLIRLLASLRSDDRTRAAAFTRLIAMWRGVAAFVLRRWGPPPPDLTGLGEMRGAGITGSEGRLVVVSTFPPRPDGIARYAAQWAESVGADREVLRIGLPGSGAHKVVRLDGVLRPLRLLAATRRGDEVVVMWHPQFFLSGRTWSRATTYLAFGIVHRARRMQVIFHEPENVRADERGAARRIAAAAERAAQRWCWSARAELIFHSERERQKFLSRFDGARAKGTSRVVRHGARFRPYARASRREARERLGIYREGRVFVCIGFLGPHKGFDRAVEAFARLPQGAARLYLIGSALYDTPEVRKHVEFLRSRVSGLPGARLEERFVEDAEFDLWIQAADAVLLPYRSAASSSVAARARLLGTRVIATPVGALPEQLGPRDILAGSDEELAQALLVLSKEPIEVGG